MKCENIIIITGISAQGKTPIALELKERFGFYCVHTDLLYHNSLKPYNGKVGQDDIEKQRFIRSHRGKLTKTTVIEGSHIGNCDELELYKKYWDFDGKVYQFKVCSANHLEQFKEKHPENTEEIYQGITKWFNSIYNIKGATIIIERVEDIINFLSSENEDLCISRPY